MSAISDIITRDIEVAKSVIALEIEGLQSLIASFDDKFVDLIDILYRSKGRVILTGMGKSGHVAKKIAATLASTGTPAIFIHPAEASHGDLGMITAEDVVIALSNSGETKELKDIINYTRRFAITLIAMVRRSPSSLSDNADLAIVLPSVAEAHEVMAPTTSTTMMMAYGDAIAVALLSRKGFNKDRFKEFHPGGKLGAELLKVKDLMIIGDAIPVADLNLGMAEVIEIMTAKRLGSIIVCDFETKKVKGIITDGDLRRHLGGSILSKQAYEIMSKNPITIDEDMLVFEALNIMNSKSITSLIVTDADGKLIGIIHIHDCLRSGVI